MTLNYITVSEEMPTTIISDTNKTVFRYNISQNDGIQMGVTYWDNTRPALIYNNTFYSTSTINCVVELTQTTPDTFSNNIFYAPSIICDTPSVFLNNVYFGGMTPPTRDSAAYSCNPMLANPGGASYGLSSAAAAYALDTASTCIDHGRYIPGNGGHDICGTTLNEFASDIGAYERPTISSVTTLNLSNAVLRGRYKATSQINISGTSSISSCVGVELQAPSIIITGPFTASSGCKIIAGTPSGALWKQARFVYDQQPRGDTTKDSSGKLSNTFHAQAFPNPFNPNVTIEYYTPANFGTNYGSITIYALSGKVVKHYTNLSPSAGQHKIEWNGKDEANKKLSSGTYLLVLIFGKNVLRQKLVLIK